MEGVGGVGRGLRVVNDSEPSNDTAIAVAIVAITIANPIVKIPNQRHKAPD